MKYNIRKLFHRIAVLAILTIVVLLFCLIFINRENAEQGQNNMFLLADSEAAAVVTVLAVCVPIALALLLVSVVYTARPYVRKVRFGRHALKNERFPNLLDIDAKLQYNKVLPYESRTLREICTEFRQFAADKFGLYYELEDIRRFMAGMGMSRLMILRGMSGTGKTSLAYAAGEYFGNSAVIVPVQPMWKERSDMIGYFNEFTKRFNETPLLCKLYEAGGNDDVYIVVLDEVNISRIEYYFAEFLSLLELPNPEKRVLSIVSDSRADDPKRLIGGKLRLPENVWFVGTANNDDSTFTISDKVYDRAAVLDLERKSESFTPNTTAATHMSYTALKESFTQACRRNKLSEKGRKAITQTDKYLTEVFRVSFGNRIMRQIETYTSILLDCGGTENGALDDILARKILRKLEQLSPVLLKNELPGLSAFLKQTFGEQALPQCAALIEQLEKSV